MSCAPDDNYFCWQYRVQLHNFRKMGYSDKVRILMFLPSDRSEWNPEMKKVAAEYPEVQFFWYKDDTDILHNYIEPYQYIPLLRPWVMAMHFKEHPELSEKAIFYHDSDILFTKHLDFTPFLGDEVNYLSDTISYIGAAYWDSKEKDVLPEKLEEYKKRDILDEMAQKLGIDRGIAMINQGSSGGAQYLLKRVDYKYWIDVFAGCIKIRGYMSYHVPGSVNHTFFANEDKGFQSWCADMWSVLWNLWKRGKETKVPKELDFAWATEPIANWETKYIYHDAGAGPQPIEDDKGKIHMLFYKKGRNGFEYANNRSTPFQEDLTYVSPTYCSYNYVQEILEAKKVNNY